MFDDLLKVNKRIHFLEELSDSFEVETLFLPEQFHLIILDVIFQASNHPKVVKIFTQYRRHKNMRVIMLRQNLFQQGKYSNTIRLNINYMILFKNPWDKLQMNTAQQMFLKKALFLENFEDPTADLQGYLIVGLTPSCPETYSLRLGVLQHQWSMVYLPKTS